MIGDDIWWQCVRVCGQTKGTGRVDDQSADRHGEARTVGGGGVFVLFVYLVTTYDMKVMIDVR